jgi:hypothetical protein
MFRLTYKLPIVGLSITAFNKVYNVERNANANLGKVYDGKKFKKIFGDKFYKFTNETETHYNFKYKDGLNIDVNKFDPTGYCRTGGLYFANLRNLFIFDYCGCNIREVEIPDDARVYVEHNKFKADKIILGKKYKIHEFINLTEEISMCAVDVDYYYLKYIVNQTEKICMVAIYNNPKAMLFVKDKTDKLSIFSKYC